jgi:hypothetical protein
MAAYLGSGLTGVERTVVDDMALELTELGERAV